MSRITVFTLCLVVTYLRCLLVAQNELNIAIIANRRYAKKQLDHFFVLVLKGSHNSLWVEV